MTSFSFLRQMLQDVRHQKMRTLLTLFGITWGTVSVALLVSFGEALEKRIKKNQHGLGESIVIAWPARTAIPFQGLGKGRRIRVSEDDIAALRREIPEATFSGEYARDTSAFRRNSAASAVRARSCASCSSTAPTSSIGSSAPYPVPRIRSTRASASTTPGSKRTVAVFVMRLTVASSTPGVFSSTRCTRAWHAAHVIPVTGMFSFAA